MPQQFDPNFPMGYVYVRLKPKHPKLGKKQGIHLQRLHALGQIWVGGDGITRIPRWYKVAPVVAEALMYFKQRQDDPNSLPAFDFVYDDEERLQIDTAEAYNRQALMGVAMLSPLPSGQVAAMQMPGPHNQPAPRSTVQDLQQSSGQAPHGPHANDLLTQQRRRTGPPSVTPGAQNFLQAARATVDGMLGQQPMQQQPAPVPFGMGPAPTLPPMGSQPQIQPQGVIAPPQPQQAAPMQQQVQPTQPQPAQPQPGVAVMPVEPHLAPGAHQMPVNQMPQMPMNPLAAPGHLQPPPPPPSIGPGGGAPVAGHGRAAALRGAPASAEGAVPLAKAVESTAPALASGGGDESAVFGSEGEEVFTDGQSDVPLSTLSASPEEIAAVERMHAAATAQPTAQPATPPAAQPASQEPAAAAPAAPAGPPPGLSVD